MISSVEVSMQNVQLVAIFWMEKLSTCSLHQCRDRRKVLNSVFKISSSRLPNSYFTIMKFSPNDHEIFVMVAIKNLLFQKSIKADSKHCRLGSTCWNGDSPIVRKNFRYGLFSLLKLVFLHNYHLIFYFWLLIWSQIVVLDFSNKSIWFGSVQWSLDRP